jgi:L-aminopeptidase/D-esterase-like protein
MSELAMKEIFITDIEGIKVGHAQNLEAGTGCSVLICEEGACGGVDVRGGAPATRETDLLNPVNLVERLHAVLLSGGSTFGLNAAAGILQYLEERDIGFDVTVTKVPIVCGASLFDLTVGDSKVRPDGQMGYEACENASNQARDQGNVGAGTGASVGKFYGMERAMKSGLGIYGLQIGELKVASMVAVNSMGDVVDPDSGRALAGLLDVRRENILDTEDAICGRYAQNVDAYGRNTTIGVTVTNGKMTKAQATKVASMTHNGFARVLRPAHTLFDGDTIFALSAGELEADTNAIGILGARTMARALRNAVLHAESAYGLKSWRDLAH